MIGRVLLLTLAVLTCNAAGFAQTCPSGASWCSGTYAYDAMGNIRAIGNDVYIYQASARLVITRRSGAFVSAYEATAGQVKAIVERGWGF